MQDFTSFKFLTKNLIIIKEFKNYYLIRNEITSPEPSNYQHEVTNNLFFITIIF